MNKISTKINNQKFYGYIRLGFFCILLVIIVLIILTIRYKKKIIDSWETDRCKPHILPFVDFLEIKDKTGKKITSKDNYKYCTDIATKNIQLNLPDFGSLKLNTALLDKIFNLVRQSIDNIRKVFLNILMSVLKFFSQIINKFNAAEGEYLYLIYKVKDIFSKITATIYGFLMFFGTTMNLLNVFFTKLPDMMITAVGILIAVLFLAIALSWILWGLIPFAAWAVAGMLVAAIFAIGILITLLQSRHTNDYGDECCFHEDTLITMNDNSKKKIKNIKLGDIIFEGGEVIGIMSATFSGYMSNFNNILITNLHAVYYNNKWIRIKDIPNIPQHYVYNVKIYCLITENHRICSNNLKFADYIETNDNNILSYIDDYCLSKLNFTNPQKYNINNKLENYEYLTGLHKNTLITKKNGCKTKIKDIKIDDELINDIKVLGVVQLNKKYVTLKKLGPNIILSSNCVIFDDKNKMYKKLDSQNIYDDDSQNVYHLITNKSFFYVENYKICDFVQYSDVEIENILINNLN